MMVCALFMRASGQPAGANGTRQQAKRRAVPLRPSDRLQALASASALGSPRGPLLDLAGPSLRACQANVPKCAREVRFVLLGLPEARFYFGCHGHMHVFRRTGYRSGAFIEDALLKVLAL